MGTGVCFITQVQGVQEHLVGNVTCVPKDLGVINQVNIEEQHPGGPKAMGTDGRRRDGRQTHILCLVNECNFRQQDCRGSENKSEGQWEMKLARRQGQV